MPQVFLHLDIRGAKGSGVGVLVLDEEKGIIVGADSGGLHYDGTVRRESGEVKAQVDVKLPSGATTLASGVTVKGPFSFPLAFSIPADDFTMSVRRVQLPSGRGTVEVQLRPIRVVE
jgi:hypothetical protein